ncbi:daptomycin-sensing surface protein LiaX [Lacticaseibacillus salsurivasis]|uniref:daptomycin-sensing surface protein LiaX n=1 Tax=Lacticaseibacillus salsurivasis TaxID=3081441 RepID=UPI0030C7018D
MNERERILDLVKQGIITSEEALVLLENLAKAQTTDNKTTAQPEAAQPQQQSSAEDEALTALNTQIAETAGSLDAATMQIKKTRAKVAANKEQIIVLDTMEDLDTLTADKYQERGALKRENEQLGEELVQLADQQEQLRNQLSDLNRQKRQLTKQRFTDHVLPDDWQYQTKSALNDIGKTVNDATNQLGSFMKKTFSDVLDNVDWKDVTVRVPGLATEKFSHTFTYPNSQASIIDVKVANGDVQLLQGDGDDITIQADVKLFGKMDGEPLQAFLDRSRIEVTDDHLIFQVPNKRVQADLIITLPTRSYDHVSLRLLNGNVKAAHLTGKDFYAKSTNGDLQFTDLDAVMLETEGVNGSVHVSGQIHDLLVDAVNGDIKVKGNAKVLNLKTVNGTVRATLVSDFTQLTASSVNGDLKLALPASVAAKGEIKTRFGSLKSRMSGVVLDDKVKNLTLDRPGTGSGELKLNVSSGNVQLKDTELTK